MMMNTASAQKLPEPLVEANGYYSLDDAQRMQAMVRALLHGRRPVALSSGSSEALEHYSRLFVRDLRQHEGVKVIAHLAGSPEKLVQQVNDLLADQPLAQVVARDAMPLQPTRVFVVHDSPQLSSEEFALLVRLVNDLPGANLRLALIQDRDPAVTGNLQALGPQALHWRVQVPGMPYSASQAASRAALREALQEAPETLPPWALPADKKPRRRWRLVFWRRSDKPAQDASKDPASAKRRPAAPAGTAHGPSRAATRAATSGRAHSPAKARSGSAGTTRGSSTATNAKASRPAASARQPAGKRAATSTPGARRNRIVLVSGILLSAVLASALGAWLSLQPAVQRAAKPAAPAAAPAPSSLATAVVSLLPRP